MATHVVEVWGNKVEITVVQKSKAVWIAHGTYLGKEYEAKGRSESDAASNWRERARYATN